MEISAVVKVLKEKGRVTIKEGHGEGIELIVPSQWKEDLDQTDGTFLIFDLFQIRTLAEQFSEVSLDVIEFASKPTIYHTPVNRVLKNGPIKDGKVKFSMIKQSYWNKLLFAFGQPMVVQKSKAKEFDFETEEYFPLLSGGTKEIFLSPDGDIKILKG
ncbi:hypothetical protein [Rhodonellum sp.]|uniref:hypothetical protein n=1 Tax=Rhodonellum sp. TaxID=2231180 RepID=UPI0027185C31|nr:hypothetical protein [Rhodonellum sp.]MDO9554154.1 hypothetical protein [Rhodonellum sp.]